MKNINSVLGLYGLEEGVPFYVKWVEDKEVKIQLILIDDEGVCWYHPDEGWKADNTKDYLLTKLLLGQAEAIRFTHKPNKGEKYVYIELSSVNNLVEYSKEWKDDVLDYSNYYCGNCFPYSEEYGTVSESVKILLYNKLKRFYNEGIQLEEDIQLGDINERS